MQTKLFFAGSGGQGILLMGQMIAYAGMMEGKEVTFMPSYGPEMRGGTANCTVIVSSSPINCPIIYEADAVVAMNLPSLLKFEPLVKPNGKLFINSTLIDRSAERTDIDLFAVPASETAVRLGNGRAANMVMLGELVRATGVVEEASIEKMIEKVFSGKKESLLRMNKNAFFGRE